MRYQCTVKNVYGDRVEVTYHSPGRESIQLSIEIPEEKNPTPNWLESQMKSHSSVAFRIWKERETVKRIANMVEDYNVDALKASYVDEEVEDDDVVEL